MSWDGCIRESTEWFDKHFTQATGLDIYSYGFEPAEGWQIIEDKSWRVLVLRFEDIGVNHLEALNAFIRKKYGGKIVLQKLMNRNLSSGKWYADLMADFYQSITFTSREMTEAYDSKYAKYFYSPEELARMRGRWSIVDY
ncbi:hypothetical protein Rhal01_02854 [Rubritalea halochordaticola]|uniref:Uncharacterized protein n=2 Tax=Rubritalea halochordaticola TaxID=714537 RepID=A0ABP9V523_9BACT